MGDYAVLFENIDIKQKAREMVSLSEDKWFYIELPLSVMALSNDAGVISVYMENGKEVKRYKLTDRIRYKNLRFSKPSEDVPTYTRRGEELYFEGGNESWRERGRVSVLLVPENIESLDTPYPIDSSVVPQVLMMAEEIGRRTLMIPQDLDNDGKDVKGQTQG